jgi:Ca2+-binding RTX toxin-like protein
VGITKLQSFDTGGGHRVQIDAGKDGSIVVLSTEFQNFLSRLDANGVETVLAPTTSLGQFASGFVETLSDGRYALYTTHHFGLGWDSRIQILNTDGSPATGIIDPGFENGQTNTLSGYTLSPTNDGGFAFVYTDISRGNDQFLLTFAPVNGVGQTHISGGSDVRIRFFDAAAAPTTASTVADDDVENLNGATVNRRALDQFINDTVTLTGGQTVFVFSDLRSSGQPDGGARAEWTLQLQIAAPGNVGEPVKIDLGKFNEVFGSDPPQGFTPNNGANIVALPNGGFAVIWTESVYKPANVHGNFAFDGTSTVIRYFDAAGTALTGTIEIVRRGVEHGNHSIYVWGEALPDGRIAIAYNKGVGGVNGNGTLDAFLGTVGPLGSSIEVSRVNADPAQNTQFYTIQDLAVRSDGTIDLVYNNAAPKPDGQSLNHTVIDRFDPGSGLNGVTVTGTDAADTISPARSLAGQPRPGALNDLLIGKAGNDRLDGGAGADVMRGGADNDIYTVDNPGDVVSEESAPGVDAGGVDLVNASVSYTLGAFVENLTLAGVGAIDGTGNALDNRVTGNDAVNTLRGGEGNDSLSGKGGNDTLHGDAGNDRLDGGLGADAMFGGAGNDSYTVDDAGDTVSEEAAPGVDAGGVDTVSASVSFTLGAFVENLTLTGLAAIDGTGNGLDNRITGNAAANTLRGGEGNDNLAGKDGADTLFGDGGNDRLDGGTGADAMHGGADNDSYTVDDVGDTVIEESALGLDAGGVDLVSASVSFTLGAFVENLTLTGLAGSEGTGNALANRITGNEGGNVLRGEGGNDTLSGKGGADTLFGGEGNDRLDGGIGADAMYGGSGDDNYVVDNAGDLVGEEVEPGVDSGGLDSVTASVSFALGAFVENLTLGGADAIDGTGNGLANRITGNSAANDLFGGDGNDPLSGGAGDDWLYGEAGLDALTGGEGADRFVLDGPTGASRDRIGDFNAAQGDKIVVWGADYGLGAGTLSADQLAIGTAATSPSGVGQFIYNPKTKALSWDADGSGGGAAVAIATLNVAVGAADFLII